MVGLFGLALAPVAAQASSSSAYVVNVRATGADDVSQYNAGAAGALSPMATPTVAGGDGPTAIAISPDAKSAYVTNERTLGADGVSQYTVGTDGALTPMATPTVTTGATPVAIAVSPDGKSAYVANDETDGAVSQYTVGVGGALSPMATPTVAAGNGPLGIAVSPDGKSVYVTNSTGAPGVSQYTVGADGALTPMATPAVAAGVEPTAIAVSPDGNSVYVTNGGSTGADGVSQYTVGTDGALTPMATTPTVAAGNGPEGIAVSPDGKSVYVTNLGATGPGGVSQYTVGTDGALKPMATPTVTTGSGPFGIAVAPSGESVYVANQNTNGPGGGGVSQYTVGAGGALTAMATPTVDAGNTPAGIAVLPDQGPVAAFSATTGQAGSPTSFDASASSDPDGTVALYTWSFDDGATDTTMSPLVTHVYANAGTFTARLTVTDDAGCSAVLVFTGQTASCNGGPQAQTTHQLTIAAPPPPPPPPPVKIGAPSAQITSPANGARYAQGQVVGAGYSCREGTGGPGVASCAGPVPNGQAINTSTTGQHSFTVTAASKDGQTSSATASYTVISANNHFTLSHIKIQRGGTVTFQVKVPGPGAVNVLENARASKHARRFVFASQRKTARKASTLKVRLSPNKRGKQLVRKRTSTVLIKLSVTYTPSGGVHRTTKRSLHLHK